ncbi:MAG: hypothetical protein COA42_18670 [Alteromonadaceae bacterium]|nr:MAG: hypothetical protein COA42_18670 [Alteromonadaceae bacterium]
MDSKDAKRAQKAIKVAKFMLDGEKQMALKKIITNTYSAAVSAYQSMASIPYVGPFLGAAAAAGVVAFGLQSAAQVAGVAHGGLDLVPKEATYLLDKGERVLSPRQNQDLTRFMDSDSGQGAAANVVVNVNEAPGVENQVSVNQLNGETTVTIDQRVRNIVVDEIQNQQAPGGVLDTGFAI